jgi:ABC-2 type transport system permease protein
MTTERVQEPFPMTTVAPARSAHVAVRATAPSLPTLVGIEIRKTLSTRSGKAVALVSAAGAPVAVGLMSMGGEPLDAVVGPVGALGLMAALLLLALGVLSTAGEWSHRTVQTTFLLVPQRGRVLAAKAGAMALLGAFIAAVAAAASTAVLAVAPIGDPTWEGVPWAIGASVAAGAAFALIGAGVGAAAGNTPAALTGLYLTMLGAMPALRMVQPEIASKVDPVDATLALAYGHGGATPALVLAGWVVLSLAAGAVLTRRRAVS